MSLLDEAKEMERRPGGTCSVALLVSRLSPPEQDELTEALAAPISAKSVARALGARGHSINYQIIARHRRRDCQCHVAP